MTKLQQPPDADKASERERLTSLVCEGLVNGESLAVACETAGVPRSTFLFWLPRYPGLQAQYREARALQVELLVDDIVSLCREARGATSSEQASAFRLEVDVQKWRVSKLCPRIYNLAPSVPDPTPLAPIASPTPVVLIRYDQQKALTRPRAMDGEVRALEAVEVGE